MSHRARVVFSAAAVALAGAVAFGGGEGPEGQTPKSAAEALAWAKPPVDSAAKAKAAETPEIVAAIGRAVAWLQPFVKQGSPDAALAKTWNLALTVSRFHGSKAPGDYVMDTTRAGLLSFGLPRGRNWTFAESGQSGEIKRTTGDKRAASSVSLGPFVFDGKTAASGVKDGAGLANLLLKQTLDSMKDVETKDAKVATKPLGKFPKTLSFEVVGKLLKEGLLRQRTFVAKGVKQVYVINVYEHRAPSAADTPFEAWQNGVEDPELEAVLAGIEETDPKKGK